MQEKKKNTIKKINSKKKEKKIEEIFIDSPFGCNCSSCPKKCN